MAIHSKKHIKGNIDDTVFAAVELSVKMPKYKFPDTQHEPRHVYSLVHDELMLDGNSRQNLATFCQTWEEPEVHRLMNDCIDKNMIDRDEYPQTAEIEARCVHMLADLWNAPEHGGVGCSTVGSSEAAMLGGLAMKRRWEARQKAGGKPTDKPNLITGPVQICWHKFTRYWDVEHREIPMDKGRLLMTPEEVLKLCDENTIGVVPTLGVTFTGEFEPVEAVSKALDQYQQDTGIDIPIHVDGASGGFLAPRWPGGQVACQYYNFLRLGREGYRQVHTACYETAQYLSDEIEKLGPFEVIFRGEMDRGIPAMCWKLKEGVDPGFNLYDYADRLCNRGWQVPAYSLPAHCEDVVIQRILVRQGVSHDLASLLLDTMREALEYFEKRPVQVALTEKEASGFHH